MEKQFNRQLIAQDYRAEAQRLNAAAERMTSFVTLARRYPEAQLAFTGGNGAPRARIGSLIVGSQYVAPILAAVPNAAVLSILLGTVAATLTNVTMGIDQAPTIVASNISVLLV